MACEIVKVGSRIAYKNDWMTVREDDVIFPDGSQSIFGVVQKVDFVAVIPLGQDGRIHLVSQYRYPVSARTWEIPQGAWPHCPEASPEEVARGELSEETGLSALQMECIGYLYQAPGLATQAFHVFLATGLTQGAPEREDTESDMETAAFTMAQIGTMIGNGRLMDGTTLAAFGTLAMAGRLSELG